LRLLLVEDNERFAAFVKEGLDQVVLLSTLSITPKMLMLP
jgi:hypothetical protein